MIHKEEKKELLKKEDGIVFLGYNNNVNYCYSFFKEQVVKFETENDYKELNIRNQFSPSFVDAYYKTTVTTKTSTYEIFDKKTFIDDVIENCFKNGLYTNYKNKVSAIYFENENIIINSNKLIKIDKNKNVEILKNRIIDKNIYLKNEKIIDIKSIDYVKKFEESSEYTISNIFNEIEDFFTYTFNFKNSNDSKIYLGWLMTNPFSLILDWSPHNYLTGNAGSGKSTLLEKSITLLKNFTKKLDNNSVSVAGITQALSVKQLSFFLDETEGKKGESKLDLFRTAASGGIKLKGSQNGDAKETAIKFSGMFAGILPLQFDNEADRGRWITIELDKLKKQENHKYYDRDDILENSGELLISSLCLNFNKVLEISKIFENLLYNKIENKRYTKLYKNSLSFYYCLKYNYDNNIDNIKNFIEQFNFDFIDDLKEQNDNIDLLNYFNNYLFDFNDYEKNVFKINILQYVSNYKNFNKNNENDFLENYGIKVEKEYGHYLIYCAFENQNFLNIFKNTKYESGQVKLLFLKNENVFQEERGKTKRINKVKYNYTKYFVIKINEKDLKDDIIFSDKDDQNPL